MEERRGYVRVATQLNIAYSKYRPSKEERLSSSKDISRGGVCLILSEELKESDLLNLKINLPTEESPLNVTGRVVWVNRFIFDDATKKKKYFAGIEFMKVDKETGGKIDQFVASFIQ